MGFADYVAEHRNQLSPSLQRALDEGERQKSGAITKIDAKLAEIKDQSRQRRDTRWHADERRQLQQKLRLVRGLKTFLPALRSDEVGSVGRLYGIYPVDGGGIGTPTAGNFAEGMWFQAGTTGREGYYGEGGGGIFKVIHVINETDTLADMPTANQLVPTVRVLITGFRHTKIEGQFVSTGLTLFEVTGRTKFHLERTDTSALGLRPVSLPVELTPSEHTTQLTVQELTDF